MMNRRAWLEAGATGMLGLALGGCATRSGVARTARPMVRLAPVDVAWDRVIRTTVGLRPYRPSGFVVGTSKVDEKTVIHNYGHGGAGHSLGWGTGQLATELALEHETRDVAVIGCGTVGLTAARQLQRHGFSVTIYAMSVPPDTTSNMALAGYTPASGVVSNSRRTAAWDQQFQRAAEIGYRQLQSLVGRGYGVTWIPVYNLMEALPQPRPVSGPVSATPLLPEHIRAPQTVLEPGEHPFPTRYAVRIPSLRIEPSIYLDALVRDFRLFNGQIVIRKFDTPADLMSIDKSVIVNCTGLGSRTLFGDEELVPVKGQLTLLLPQAEVDYGTFGAPPGRDQNGFTHMMPRSDGIALGGTTEEGEWDLTPNDEARRRIVETHIELFRSMGTGR